MCKRIIVLIAVSGIAPKFTKMLESLKHCTLPASYSGTIIIENGAKNEIENLIEEFKENLNIKYLYYRIANKSMALNHALKYIPQDTLIIFSDDDVVFDKDLLKIYDEAKNKSGFFFGGRVLPIYEKEPPPWLYDYLPDSAQSWPNKNLMPNRFLGANWGVCCDYINKAGGFDKRFGPGTIPRRTGQERKMQDDLVRFGIKPYFLSEAKVWHHVPASKSSVKFALDRLNQTGISIGIKLRNEKSGFIRLVSMIFIRLLKIIYYLIKNVIIPNNRNNLTLQRELKLSSGIIKGYYIH